MKNTSEMIGKVIEVKTVNDTDTIATLVAIEDLGILLESKEEYSNDDTEGEETVTWYIPFRNIARIQYSPHGTYDE